MNNQEAIQVIKAAVKYSTKENPGKEMNNAIGCFAEMNGWTKDNAAIEFVNLCLKGAEDYKNDPINSYMLKDVNDASNVALYVDRQAANDIIDQRAAK